jgi:hypothetical protein
MDNNVNPDISQLLREWPYEAGKLNVRMIQGEDGEPRIQMRLDLGLLQMHAEGRPDGERPYGFESLLEYYESLLDEWNQEHGYTAGNTPTAEEGGFSLSPEDCRLLREEAVQYYHRYMALLVLEDYEGVVRDTSRNLRVLDLCARHAAEEDDREALEPFRAYITMMRARALASQALKDNEPKAAIHAIDEGLEALRQHFAKSDEPGAFDASSEVQMLRGMREALVPRLPPSPRAELEKRLAKAIAAENYELAAILRDEIKQMGDAPGAARG